MAMSNYNQYGINDPDVLAKLEQIDNENSNYNTPQPEDIAANTEKEILLESTESPNAEMKNTAKEDIKESADFEIMTNKIPEPPSESDENHPVGSVIDVSAFKKERHSAVPELPNDLHYVESDGIVPNKKYTFAIVEFKGHRRDFFINIKSLELKVGDLVIVTVENGKNIGKVVFVGQEMLHKDICEKYNQNIQNSIVNISTDPDIERYKQNKIEETAIIKQANVICASYGLDMKVIDTEWQWDRGKLTIFFTAPNRVDFRELVKELAKQFRTRIELRQINTREEMKRVGNGIGCCGQTMCCISFANIYNKANMEHAKVQQISNNISKLSGNCRRLKCCMSFEYDFYEEELAKYPLLCSTIQTENNTFNLYKIDIFKQEFSLYETSKKKTVTLSVDELQKLLENAQVIPPKVTEIDVINDEDLIIE